MTAKQGDTTPHITPPIIPHPGYILTQPYIPADKPFMGVREEAGQDQKSLVLKVGSPVIDSNNITRSAGVSMGDIIIHAQTNKDFELDFTLYRFVHFTEVHGVLQEVHEPK